MPDSNITDATGLYTASEVEQRTGVPATTLRQWERRYGMPRPVRSASGYRLYSGADLARIEFLRARLSEGITISRAVQLCEEEFRLPVSAGVASDGPDGAADELLAAVLQPGHGPAGEILSRALGQYTVEDVLMRIVQPVLWRIGDLWARGQISVAHEHQASAYLRGRIAQLLDYAGSPGFGPLVVAACAPGEHHEIGLLMLAVVLRRAGVRVLYLGSNMPFVDLVDYARSAGAVVLLVSLNSTEALRALRPQLRSCDTSGLKLFFGGALVNARPELARELGGTHLGTDAVSGTAALMQWLRSGEREALHGGQEGRD